MTAPRILLLDNDSFSLGAMHTLFTDEGYRVFRCRPRDLADAHRIVRRAAADLVILDRGMAKHDDGWLFLRRLSADRETAHIPAIIASDKPDIPPGTTDLLRTMHYQVMAKPFDANALLAALEAALGPSPARSARGEVALAGTPEDAHVNRRRDGDTMREQRA
jgi:DNA-binding response OmpR family regulator